MYTINTLTLYQVMCMLNTNIPTAASDAVFFHARGLGDDDGLFELAAELIDKKKAQYVVINGGNGYTSTGQLRKTWPGKDAYLEKLTRHVDPRYIVLAKSATNTVEENRAFLSIAREKGWASSIAIAQPHQILRIMLGGVKEITKHRMKFHLYSTAPTLVDWKKSVQASQGAMREGRFDDIQAELERIPSYIAKGDISTLEELIIYLQSR